MGQQPVQTDGHQQPQHNNDVSEMVYYVGFTDISVMVGYF